MTEIQQNIITRRSIRKYKPDMLPKETIDRIIEAGTYAATGMGNLMMAAKSHYFFSFSHSSTAGSFISTTRDHSFVSSFFTVSLRF